MQALIRKTLKLFASYPVLWLPFVCAELVGIGLDSLQRLTLKPLLTWFATRHTVFGGEDQVYDQAAQHKAIMASMPLEWGTRYLTFCLSAIALLLTAALVSMILRGQKPDLATAVAEALRAYPRRIAAYALKFWVLSTLLYALVGQPTSFLFKSLPNVTFAVWNVIWGSETLLILLCSAWIMAPISLALLRPADAVPASPLQRQQARFFSIGITVATFLLSRLLDPPILKLIGNIPYRRGIFSVTSLPIQLPNVFLLIALALIASESEEAMPDLPPLGPRIKRALEPLMPLHFRSCPDTASAEGEQESCADGESK